MIRRRKFVLGVRSKPTNIPTADNGDISVSSVDNKLKVTTYSYPAHSEVTAYVVGDKVRYADTGYNYVCIQNNIGDLPTDPAFWQIYEQSVVTEDQTQTLTNKSIDADTNPISNIETDNLKAGVLVTDISLATADTEIPSALAVKSALALQNEASEIDFTPITNVAGPKVQDAIGQVQGNIQSHIDSLTAHDAANIDYGPLTPANWDVAPTKVEGALDELASRTGTVEGSISGIDGKTNDLVTLSGVAANSTNLGTFTGTIISDNTTVKPALQALETHTESVRTDYDAHALATEAHGATGAVVGTTNTQTLTNKTYDGAIFTKMVTETSELNAQTGANVLLNEPTQPIVLLSEFTLTSIAGINQATSDKNKVVTLINTSTVDIDILNDSLSVAVQRRILTGTGDDITLSPDSAIMLKYETEYFRWRVIGGTGSGSTIVKGTAGENLTANDYAALRSNGLIYKLDASNDNSIEYIGIVKASATIGNPVKIVSSGIVKGFSGLTAGAPVYAAPSFAGLGSQADIDSGAFNNKWVIKVGIAVSTTEVLINPDQAASAYFNNESFNLININNNQVSAANVSDLIFDGSLVKSALIEYSLYRKTDTEEVMQSGSFRVHYKPIEMTWFLGAESYLGDNAGVTFSITNAGQVQYVSTNIAGANYEGTFNYNVSQLFNV